MTVSRHRGDRAGYRLSDPLCWHDVPVPDLVAPVVPAGSMCRQPQPVLTVDALTLRSWQPADVSAVVEAYRDPAIQHWHGRSMTEDEAQDWVSSWTGRWAAETGAGWAITQDGAVLGRVGLRTVNLAEGVGEAAYWVLPLARGHDVAPRALQAVTAWVFDHLGLQRVELAHSTSNGASCRVASKAGYALEGTKRQQALHADGWHDMHLHARLRDDPVDVRPASRTAQPMPA